MAMKHLAVLGAGSWGTALALNCCRADNIKVSLWAHREAHANKLQKDRCNQRYLPDIPFPDHLEVTSQLSVVKDADAILIVTPSTAFSEMLTALKPYLKNQDIAWAIKGFDKQNHCILSETFRATYPQKEFVIIAGPSFAKELATKKPTALSLAANNIETASQFATYLNNDNLVIYLSDDVVATQVGGALKNVIAITSGIADGLHLGANARSALITRGLHEITRLGMALGGHRETFMGLSGLGDLVLTCTDDKSRNRRFGKLIGQGHSTASALELIGQTVEGIYTTHDCIRIADQLNIRMPIASVTQQVLNQNISVSEAMKLLLSNPPKKELN